MDRKKSRVRWAPYTVIQENLFYPVKARPQPFIKRTIIIDDYLDRRTWFTPGQSIGKGGGVDLESIKGEYGAALPTLGNESQSDALPNFGSLDNLLQPSHQGVPFSPEFIRDVVRGSLPGGGGVKSKQLYEGDYNETAPVTPVTPKETVKTPDRKGKKKERVKGEGTGVAREIFPIEEEDYAPPTSSPFPKGSTLARQPSTPTSEEKEHFKRSQLKQDYPNTRLFKKFSDVAPFIEKIRKATGEYNDFAKDVEYELSKRGYENDSRKLNRIRAEAANFLGGTTHPNSLTSGKSYYRSSLFNLLRLENKLIKYVDKLDKK